VHLVAGGADLLLEEHQQRPAVALRQVGRRLHQPRLLVQRAARRLLDVVADVEEGFLEPGRRLAPARIDENIRKH